MNQDIDKFSQFIGDKLNDFEVPYNESHWDELSNKLDSTPALPKASSGIASKVWWVAAIGVLAVATWLVIDKEDKVKPEITDQNAVLIEKSQSQEFQVIPKSENQENEVVVDEVKSEVSSESQDISNENQKEVDEKIEKYAEHTEQNILNESKKSLNEILNEDKALYVKDEPLSNNLSLKTEIQFPDQLICSGQEVQFSVDREIDGAKYYWDFGDGDLKSRKVNPIHTFKKKGTFMVRLNVSQGEIGSKNDWSTDIEVRVEKSPEIELISEENQISIEDPYARFSAESNENCTYRWEFNGSEKTRGKEVSFLIKKVSSYPVKLTATNENACSTHEEITYHASKSVEMFAEKAFTPNGDGLDDNFIPKELEISNVEFTFIVLDKTGGVVFETNDKYRSWNGKMNNNGADMPTGVYPWKVVFTDGRGKKHQQNGAISLIR